MKVLVEIPEEFRPFVSDYKINVFEIAFLPEEAVSWFHSDFRIMVDYFVHRRTNPDYRPSDPDKFRHVDEVLKMMAAITHDSRFTEALNGEGGKPKDMCEVLDRVEAKGKQEGIKEGRKEGIKEGRKEGIKEGRKEGRIEGIDENRLENIKTVMRKLHYSVQQAMEFLDIPLPDQSKYLAKL